MTTKNKILMAVVGLLILIFFLDRLAFAQHLYWRFWWMDIVMHLLAGFAIGLLALHFGFLLRDKGREGYPEKRLWLRAIILSLIIGLGWEWYELLVHRVPDLFIGTNEINPLSPVWLGKISDIVVNLIGTVLAVGSYFWCNKISKKVDSEDKNNNKNNGEN